MLRGVERDLSRIHHGSAADAVCDKTNRQGIVARGELHAPLAEGTNALTRLRTARLRGWGFVGAAVRAAHAVQRVQRREHGHHDDGR
jgi:hypothetical protein